MTVKWEKKKRTKAQSRILTSDFKLGRPVPYRFGHGFLGFFLGGGGGEGVQGNILIPFFLFSQSIFQDETQSMHSQCYTK